MLTRLTNQAIRAIVLISMICFCFAICHPLLAEPGRTDVAGSDDSEENTSAVDGKVRTLFLFSVTILAGAIQPVLAAHFMRHQTSIGLPHAV